jgi:hypothetical protein
LDQGRFKDQILAYWESDHPPTQEDWLEMCLFVRQRLDDMWTAALEELEAPPAHPPVCLKGAS